MDNQVDETAVQPTYKTLEELEAPMPDIHGMRVLPMCHCRLPAKVHRVYPKSAATRTPYPYFLGCRKTSNKCSLVMWCKLRNRNAPEEDDGVEVFDHLVLKNMELEECIEDMDKQIETLKFQIKETKAYLFA
ncbi:hypothetical protein LINPERPRIM_LOCUS39078 [Linum perenne]